MRDTTPTATTTTTTDGRRLRDGAAAAAAAAAATETKEYDLEPAVVTPTETSISRYVDTIIIPFSTT